MTTTRDISLDNYDQLSGSLDGFRKIVHAWLMSHGPATTRQIAHGTGLDILTVRPRVTELMQAGLADLHGKVHREGMYRGVSIDTAWQRVLAARAEKEGKAQLNFDF
jgi:hypothetical protein